ncbi:MAG: hypothetical protein Q8R67_04395 [Rhodoferax sp.]|nr:hypothetical protein [Rhodoferax sp.]
MGNVPLTHSEIAAWQRNTGVDLTAWEAQTLRQLSRDYLGESQSAEAPDCPAPWSPLITETTREDVSKKVQNAFRTLMTTRPKR